VAAMTSQFWREGTVVRRSCSRCRERWIAGQFACWRCRSVIFDETPEPTKVTEKRPASMEGWS
jgi:hypothetical protein